MMAAFLFVGFALMACGFVIGYVMGLDGEDLHGPRDAHRRRVPHKRRSR